MGKRKITVLEEAATSIAEIGFYIEAKGLPVTAKKFVDDVFDYFDEIAIDTATHKLCTYKRWQPLGYHCVSYKKKYVIAYLNLHDEITICDFVAEKLLKD